MREIGILGGGIAGLSLAYFLGEDCEVLEKGKRAGGLCRSFHKDGFTFDMGGHILFSKDQEILDLELALLEGRVNKLQRKAVCWFKDRFVKYPFENELSSLDKEDAYECLIHFIANPQRPQQNFQDWIYNTFGKGLAELYLLPYNEKIWKMPAEFMDCQWVERIPKPPLEDIVKAAVGIETEGYTHQLHFHYPTEGGFETLPQAFEQKIGKRIVKNFPVARITKDGGNWLVTGESNVPRSSQIEHSGERKYKKLVCTMPIFELIKCLHDVPVEVRNACSNLVVNSLSVVMVGLNRPRKHDYVCCFFPQRDIIFHRLVFQDYFGSNYTPTGCSSMVCEITCKFGDAVWSMTDEELTERVIDDLCREGFIDKTEVLSTAVKKTKYAYPVYDLARERNLRIVRDYCDQMQIELCGRFAEFKYDNSDQVIRSAKNLASKLSERVGLRE